MTRLPVPTDPQEIQRRLHAGQQTLQDRLRQHNPADPWNGTTCGCGDCDVTARQITVIHKVRTDRCCWCGTAHQCPWHDTFAMDHEVCMATLALADSIVARSAVTP